MKYKLIKKLDGMPEWLVFEYNKDLEAITTNQDVGLWLSYLLIYINLVWIDDKDSFEKIEDEILVPDEIKIEEFYWSLYINKWKQSLWYDKWEYCVDLAIDDNLAKCKLVKTTVWELKAGDVLCDDINKKNELSRYSVYLWDWKLVYWYEEISKWKLWDDFVYKVVKV